MRKPVHRYEDTAANWSADNPKLPAGWEGVESDTGRYKCGNGSTAWNSLAYSLVTGTITAANTAARLALTNLPLGAKVKQTDNGFTYMLNVFGGESTAANWLPTPKVYSALLTQTGTDAPVATVLENTLGGEVVWARNSAGRYVAALAGAFTDNKTVMPGGTTTDSDGFLSGFTSTSWIDADSMQLWTQAIADLTLRADDLLLETPITIEVYP